MSLSLPVITLLLLNDILLFIFFRINVFTVKLYFIIPEIIKLKHLYFALFIFLFILYKHIVAINLQKWVYLLISAVY